MKPAIGKQLLYLSKADVEACGITAAEMNTAIDDVFRAKSEGRAWTQPKLAIFLPDGASLRAKGGMITSPDYGAVKIFGYFPGNEQYELPDFHPLVALNEGRSGMPIAVMDGIWISAIRTGCLSAVSAKYMARPDSSSVGFVACGSQARANLDALLPLFKLKRVVAYSRRLATAQAFAEFARGRGVEAVAVTDPRQAVHGLDIVITSVPHGSPEAKFLDGNDVSPGTFVSMVDLGYGWKKETIGNFDRVVTDDVEQNGPLGAEKLNYGGDYAGEIADLCGGKLVGRKSPTERTALIFSGIGLADTAAAVLVYERAVAKGLGTVLPL